MYGDAEFYRDKYEQELKARIRAEAQIEALQAKLSVYEMQLRELRQDNQALDKENRELDTKLFDQHLRHMRAGRKKKYGYDEAMLVKCYVIGDGLSIRDTARKQHMSTSTVQELLKEARRDVAERRSREQTFAEESGLQAREIKAVCWAMENADLWWKNIYWEPCRSLLEKYGVPVPERCDGK